LWVLFADAAHRAVVLRKGPTQCYRLSLWDTQTDVFTHGQWMKGFVTLWDLSPQGDLLLYFAQQYNGRHNRERAYDPLNAEPLRRQGHPKRPHRKVPCYIREKVRVRDNMGIWTALSRPPYFSALAIWPSCFIWTRSARWGIKPNFGTGLGWSGGGWFGSRNDIVLHETEDGLVPKLNVPDPLAVRVRCATEEERTRLHPYPFSATRPYDPDTPRAPCSVEVSLGEAVTARLVSEGARWVEWCFPKPNGDLLFACDGCIYRLTAWRGPDHAGLLREARCLADFRNMTFSCVAPPPEVMCWPQ